MLIYSNIKDNIFIKLTLGVMVTLSSDKMPAGPGNILLTAVGVPAFVK